MMQNVSPLTAGAVDRFAGICDADLSEAERTSVVRLALTVLQARHQPGEFLQSPSATRDYLRLLLSDRKNEVFGTVFLDGRHRVLGVEELFQGTLDGTSVHPRVVVQRALACNAGATIFFHNHPSGTPEPSNADALITQKLRDALALIDVRVLDHIVVGFEDAVSFAERGLL